MNIVGSSVPSAREVDDLAVKRARLFADCETNVLAQGGEFLHAMEHGGIGRDHLLGEIGDVLNDRIAGRLTPDDITMYKSLGHAAQDVFVSDHALQQARVSGIGTIVDW